MTNEPDEIGIFIEVREPKKKWFYGLSNMYVKHGVKEGPPGPNFITGGPVYIVIRSEPSSSVIRSNAGTYT